MHMLMYRDKIVKLYGRGAVARWAKDCGFRHAESLYAILSGRNPTMNLETALRIRHGSRDEVGPDLGDFIHPDYVPPVFPERLGVREAV